MDPQQVSLDAAPLASSTFTASWTPSKAAAFNANNVPLNKLHRAWERKPLQSKSDNGKTKTVWKRYQLRSQPGVVPDEERDEQHSDESAAKSPGRIVKKARVVSPVKGRHSDGAGAQGRRKSSATKCERRKSGYRRKFICSNIGLALC